MACKKGENLPIWKFASKGDDISSVINLDFYEGRTSMSEIVNPFRLVSNSLQCDHNESNINTKFVYGYGTASYSRDLQFCKRSVAT